MENILYGYSLVKGTYKIYKKVKKYKSYKDSIYNMDMKSKKERSDMILEPLQVMIQLALLSHCPIGTKVSVSDNILQLHQPTMYQGLWRWYNSDSKDDLYYLFHAIRRYYKWYKSDENNKIFTYILSVAIKGIDKLIATYSASDQTAITHTLSLYKNVLDLESPDLFKDPSQESVNIDTVFSNIKDIYDKRLLKIIYNTLMIMESVNDEQKKSYLLGLLNILNPTNELIRGWIRDKLTC